jgi:hypothetical protein
VVVAPVVVPVVLAAAVVGPALGRVSEMLTRGAVEALSPDAGTPDAEPVAVDLPMRLQAARSEAAPTTRTACLRERM